MSEKIWACKNFKNYVGANINPQKLKKNLLTNLRPKKLKKKYVQANIHPQKFFKKYFKSVFGSKIFKNFFLPTRILSKQTNNDELFKLFHKFDAN